MVLSNQAFILLMIMILRYPIDKDSQEFSKLDSYILNDLKCCPKCFENQSDFCELVRHEYEFDEDFINKLNNLFGVRHTRVLSEIRNRSHRIVAKYLARDFNLNSIDQNENDMITIENLSVRFFNDSRLDGMQFCPHSEVKRFIQFFGNNYTTLNIWMHMNIDMQPILLPYLHSMGFPVPSTYATCGFTTFQSADGDPLAKLYSSDFTVKLKIAAQLIEGALKFSEGFEGFRIYITDLNMDNVVYSAVDEKVSFVDLDTVLIVDGRKSPNTVHKHEYLECDDCFAYSPTDICAHGQSDINLFSVCQFLRENLRKDRTNGFLYPVPEEYSDIEDVLKECVDCHDCVDRFGVALKLVNIFKTIIKKSSP